MLLLSALRPIMQVFIDMGTVAVLWLGGYQVIASSLSVGEIMAFINYLLSTMFPLAIPHNNHRMRS